MRGLCLVFVLFISNNLISQMDSVSYSAGLIIAKNLKTQGFTDLDRASFMDAIKDVYEGNDVKISLDEANQNFKSHVENSKSKMDMVNKEAGVRYLANNADKEGVMVTESGLQYKIIESKNPTLSKPTLLDKVKVHYHGTTVDGAVFDSSVDRGEPISFPLNGVIKGWQEGLQLMPVGSKFKFFIPQELAYGSRSMGPKIKPYSALIFDVTLLAIE